MLTVPTPDAVKNGAQSRFMQGKPHRKAGTWPPIKAPAPSGGDADFIALL